MAIQVGDRIPDVPLTLATPEGPVPVKSGDYFAGKRVALFAVPGRLHSDLLRSAPALLCREEPRS